MLVWGGDGRGLGGGGGADLRDFHCSILAAEGETAATMAAAAHGGW